MIAMKDYRDKAKGLADLLPYAAIVDNGIVLCKDGSLLAAWRCRSQDTASSTDDELAAISIQVNNAFKQLGSGWMCHVDALRTPAKSYPDVASNHFPDPITAFIDEERRHAFESHGNFFSTTTYLTLAYRPQLGAEKLSDFAQENAAAKVNPLTKSLEQFKTAIDEFEDALSVAAQLERLEDQRVEDEHGQVHTESEILSYLQHALTGINQPMRLPDIPMYLDAILGGQDMTGGLIPTIDNKAITVLALDGLPIESWPAMLSTLEGLPIEYRFSSRYIFLDQFDAEKEMDKYRKTWRQQMFRIWDSLTNNPNARANRDAMSMAEDAEQAIAEVQSGLVGGGFYTSAIVLLHDDPEQLEEWTRTLRRILRSLGFGCRIEKINVLEAWLGTHPGNGYANIRRPMINTLNFADLLPLATIWAGREHNPSPLFPSGSPPLMYCATDGSTPFRLNLHVDDLGHTLIFGPTGSGKSTLLAIIAAQFRRYPDASIFCFDKGNSMFPICKAAGGTHYDVAGDDSTLAFCPLQHIDSNTEQSWCEEWVVTMCELQGLTVLPTHRNAIHAAMTLLRANPENMRSLSDLYHTIQDAPVKEAIKHYTQEGAMGHLLDASEDTLGVDTFTVFEIEKLMELGDKNLIPVLLYIFHRIEKALKGQPGLLILDEAWIALGHAVFREKIREWLKVLRKAGCAVVLATQSLSDAVRSGIFDVLVESCPTQILLPNHKARQEGISDMYRGMGLNSRQIDIVASATPKREYYVTSPEGRRLISLALGPIALAFVGASDKESIARIKELEQQYGQEWPEEWLRERGAA
ncbi:MAG: conjugal transfer protein TrbE [Pseudodesulfovibrio sp.]|nr:conjugal transfer protein TrbE [Pseudodesulfovibrio sp.]